MELALFANVLDNLTYLRRSHTPTSIANTSLQTLYFLVRVHSIPGPI